MRWTKRNKNLREVWMSILNQVCRVWFFFGDRVDTLSVSRSGRHVAHTTAARVSYEGKETLVDEVQPMLLLLALCK
jgi:hypothetical protein